MKYIKSYDQINEWNNSLDSRENILNFLKEKVSFRELLDKDPDTWGYIIDTLPWDDYIELMEDYELDPISEEEYNSLTKDYEKIEENDPSQARLDHFVYAFIIDPDRADDYITEFGGLSVEEIMGQLRQPKEIATLMKVILDEDESGLPSPGFESM